MLSVILILNLILCLPDAKSSPKPGLEDLENLVEKLVASRLKDMETRTEETEMRLKSKEKEMERMEQNNQEMKRRLEELENKMRNEKDELETRKKGMKTSTSKQKMQADDSLRKEIASNFTNAALTVNKPSLRDLPIVVISAWRSCCITSPQTITFDSFVANFNGDLDLDSGVFTCFIPGFYTVSFTGSGMLGPAYDNVFFHLFKNGLIVLESEINFRGAISDDIGVSISRILILHMDAGDKLDLRMTKGTYAHGVTLNIELIGGEE